MAGHLAIRALRGTSDAWLTRRSHRAGIFSSSNTANLPGWNRTLNTQRGGIYGIGLPECMPTARAEGGPGYGTGITEADVRELAARAGFREVTRVMPEDPMRSFFVLRA
jgi:hypothetical protein